MNIIIIGNGISGVTAARHLRKQSDHGITIISSETKYFFSRTALMYVYMGHMGLEQIKPYEDSFWEKNRINLLQAHINHIDFQKKELTSVDGQSIKYDKLVLALGSKSNYFGWPGQDLKGVGGLYHMQDLEQMEAYSPGLERAVVTGGGLIGIEMAEMFHSRKIPVTMLVREDSYWDNVLPPEESAMVTRHIRSHHIDLRLGVNLGEIIDDGTGRACGVVIKESGERIPCGYVGLTAGVSPNVAWLKDTSLEVERGIKVNEYLQTNVADVYAIGDCVQLTNPHPGRRSIEAIWYTGRMMGETVAYNILGKKVAYNPGVWFNSAKFLDIEYQVYGDVPSHLGEDYGTIYWEHTDGKRSVRINYNKTTKAVSGFNLMGIRFRHEVCEKWLREETPVTSVMSQLSLAYFDPEFYKTYSREIAQVAEKELGVNVTPPAKTTLNKVLTFLKN